MVLSPDASFCIDSQETTFAQYITFVDASTTLDASTLALPGFCPPDADRNPANNTFDAGSLPVMYVSFCDAYAYCRWAGKHLCRETTEWQRACTNDGSRKLPYGDTPGLTTCNVGALSHVEAGTFPQCEGGYQGLFDMVGNVAELVDGCEGDGAACPFVGGGYYSPALTTTCATRESQQASAKAGSYGVGFRCCF